MNRVSELVGFLQRRMQAFGFSESARGRIGQVDFAGVFATPKRRSQRLICAVARVPETVGQNGSVQGFAGLIRRGLAKQYAPFPWPKRLGTYTILLGEREQCERLRRRKDQLVDSSGLHVNVLLGTVLVDLETFRLDCDNVWGLIDAGEQFKQIQNAVENWCRRYRPPVRLAWTNGRGRARSAAHASPRPARAVPPAVR